MALLALFSATSAFGLTSYSTTVSNVTTVTVTNAQHGFNSKYFAVTVYDNESVRVQPSDSPGYSYSINASTYAVTVNFTSSFSGTVKLIGPFTGVTTHNRDFAVSTGVDGGSGTGFMKVCSECTLELSALRSWSGKSWFSAGPVTLTLTAAAGGGTWRAWLEDQKVVFGYTNASVGGSATCSGMPCEVRFSQSGFPTGSIPLGYQERSGVAGQHWVGSPTDSRP